MADDSVEPLITECPACHTRFRVTEAQLTVASGRVRCGACKDVFRGADHLVLSMDAPRLSEDPDAALDALLNELSQVSTKHEPRRPEPTPVPRVVREPPQERVPPSTPASIGYEPRVTVMRDVPRRRLRRPIQAAPPPRPRVDIDNIPVPANEHVEGPGEGTAPAVDVAPAPVVEPIEALPARHVAEEPAAPLVAKVVEVPPVVERTLPKRAITPPQVEEIVLVEHAAATPFGAGDAPRRGAVRIPVDPLGLSVPPFGLEERVARRKRWWVFPAIFAALLALVGQVLWFQFEAWARDPEIRPVYEWLCAGLGCELPVMRALDAFRTKNLVVRAHPEKPGVLAVDAIIVNDASFVQPYPEIELRFSAIGGNLVAARRFSPTEYLAGDAAAAKVIGAHTPVHIALDIEDPGTDAVNYIITFR